MKLRGRLDRLRTQLGADQAHPLTLFLRPLEPGLTLGRRVVWDGIGLEIVFDPADGWPELPPGGPHKLMLGMDPDWV